MLPRYSGDYTFEEFAMLNWLGSIVPAGEERFVHLGTGLGTGTVAIAQGLARNKSRSANTSPVIAGFDSYLMPNDQFTRAWIGPEIGPGRSFFHKFVENIPPHLRVFVEPYVFVQESMPVREQPIALLVDEWGVTPARSRRTADALQHCSVGTLFVQRRAAFGWLPWATLLIALVRPSIIPLARAGTSQIWGFTRTPPDELQRIDPWTDLPLAAQIDLLDAEIANAQTPYLAAMVEMSRALTMFLKGDEAAGIQALEPGTFARYDLPYVTAQVDQMRSALESFGSGTSLALHQAWQFP